MVTVRCGWVKVGGVGMVDWGAKASIQVDEITDEDSDEDSDTDMEFEDMSWQQRKRQSSRRSRGQTSQSSPLSGRRRAF